MLTTYLRSSSFSSWGWCATQYTFNYLLGYPSSANQKTVQGSICHKALEILARKKLAQQNNASEFADTELGRKFSVDLVAPENALLVAFNHYSDPKTSPFEWSAKDYEECDTWMRSALFDYGGQFSPLNRHILAPEQYFDFELSHCDWAKYEYVLPDGEILQGTLALKGTVDLVTLARPGVIEYIDWKSGKRIDWNTGAEKGYKDFRKDPQLRLYHYALRRLYPEAKHILITIFFLRSGGPFTIDFSDDDLAETEQMVREKFEEIAGTTVPSWIRGNPRDKWKCQRLCRFYSEKFHPDDKYDMCRTLRDELVELGMDRVLAKRADLSVLSSYREGGGKTHDIKD